jgi:hypothetical protein
MQIKTRYIGPVLYIIHAPTESPPEFLDAKEKTIWAANKKRIILALELAGRRNIPVLYNAEQEEKQLKKMVNALKRKPRIVWIKEKDTASPALRTRLKGERILPTQVLGFGMYRNMCVMEHLKQMKRAFPTAEVILLEGHATLFLNRRYKKEKYQREAARYRIKRRKKISFKH